MENKTSKKPECEQSPKPPLGFWKTNRQVLLALFSNILLRYGVIIYFPFLCTGFFQLMYKYSGWSVAVATVVVIILGVQIPACLGYRIFKLWKLQSKLNQNQDYVQPAKEEEEDRKSCSTTTTATITITTAASAIQSIKSVRLAISPIIFTGTDSGFNLLWNPLAIYIYTFLISIAIGIGSNAPQFSWGLLAATQSIYTIYLLITRSYVHWYPNTLIIVSSVFRLVGHGILGDSDGR